MSANGSLSAFASAYSTGPATPASSPAAEPTEPTESPAQPSEEPTSGTVSGVYYLIDTRTGFRLVRELRDLAGDDPVAAAVEAMVAAPEDPDYSTMWNPGIEVLGTDVAPGSPRDVVSVDLSAEARTANAGSEVAERMVQQLVYTVTEALGDESAAVRLLVEGEPAGELWGSVVWDEPVSRADPLDVRSLVQIDTPREGATVSSPVRVEGDAAVFEATLPWRVLDQSGAEVTSGTATTAEGQTFAAYSFSVELEPGSYTVEITEDDPSGGEGGALMVDTRTITVE